MAIPNIKSHKDFETEYAKEIGRIEEEMRRYQNTIATAGSGLVTTGSAISNPFDIYGAQAKQPTPSYSDTEAPGELVELAKQAIRTITNRQIDLVTSSASPASQYINGHMSFYGFKSALTGAFSRTQCQELTRLADEAAEEINRAVTKIKLTQFILPPK